MFITNWSNAAKTRLAEETTTITFTDNYVDEEGNSVSSTETINATDTTVNAFFVKIVKKLRDTFNMFDYVYNELKTCKEACYAFACLFAEIICIIGSLINMKKNKKASRNLFFTAIASYLGCLFFATRANDKIAKRECDEYED